MESPVVDDLSWGEVTVREEGEEKTYRDAKLWPGGSRNWDWNETGTSHTPGIQVADVRELVENGAERVILSRGQNNRLDVKTDTLDWLDEQGVKVDVLESNEAVKTYNALAGEEPVGALIHSTC